MLHVCYVFAILDRIIIGQLAPLLQTDLELSDTDLGLIQGIGFAVCYTLFGLGIGWMVDRFTRKHLVAIGIVIWSFATVASAWALGFWTLALARVGVAMGEASLNPAASSLISDYFPRATRPLAYGIYQMGAAIGSLLSYILSGVILASLDDTGHVVLPLIGELAAWQIVFIAIGVPGIFSGMLVASIHEPTRKGLSAELSRAPATWAAVFAFLNLNRRTFIALFGGVSLTMMSVYGMLFWLASFFQRVHDLPPSWTGIWYGLTGGVIGVVSAAISGPITRRLVNQGREDGAMLTCLIGAAGVFVIGTAAPLMPSAFLALGAFAIVKIFINLPTSAALTSINEITPNELRGKVTSIYILVFGILASGSGALIVALITEHLFGDPAAIGWSLALVNGIACGGSVLLLAWGLKGFRESRKRAAVWND